MTADRTPAFDRYIGIDYSGAKTPTSSLKGLRVYMADRAMPPFEVLPPPGPRNYWSRRGMAEWLVERLTENRLTMVGIDHAFSFPLLYFETYHLQWDWPAFLDDFQQHWPSDESHTWVQDIRDGTIGNGAARSGNAHWRRRTEILAGAKSAFHFDFNGSVAKSTHAGLPWLRYLRQQLGERVHFWPFDGWNPPANSSVIVEVYPSLWSPNFPREKRIDHQQDAYSTAAWMRQADVDGTLPGFLDPPLTPANRTMAQIEGWILGVNSNS